MKRLMLLSFLLVAPGCLGAFSMTNAQDGELPPPSAPPAVEFQAAQLSLRRLTVAQYRNAIAMLLGKDAPNGAALVEIPKGEHFFRSIGAAYETISGNAADGLEQAAFDATAWVFADDARKKAFTGCGDAPDEGCMSSFIESFGKRAFRRPLTTEEKNGYLAAIRTTFADVPEWQRLQHVTAAMLESPSFLYQIELGEEIPGEKRDIVAFNGWEMATRIAFALTNAPPDDGLLAAAASGALYTEAGIAEQVDRLLANPETRAGITTFFSEYFSTDMLDKVVKSGEYANRLPDSLRSAMKEEISRVVDRIVWEEKSDFRRIMTRRDTFVNAELAQHYGIEGVTGAEFTAVTIPANWHRGGFFGFGGWLAAFSVANRSSPTFRGKFVRVHLLCNPIPPPPANFDNSALEPNAEEGPSTMRQRLDNLIKPGTSCQGCHRLMDPLGLSIENFDAVGAFREKDHGLTLDTTGQYDDGTAFADVRGLAQLIENDPRFPDCIATHAYRYLAGQNEENSDDESLKRIRTAFRDSGYRVDQLVKAVLTSPSFRFAAKPKQ